VDATSAPPRATTVVPAAALAERFAVLRAVWLEVASDIATVGPVNELLMNRLTSLEALGVASEHDLLTIAEDAAQVALQVTTAEGARTLSKRLRRAVYEYLLAVDAAAAAAAFQAEPAVAVVVQPARPGSMMIGLEEVAEARAQPPPQADSADESAEPQGAGGALEHPASAAEEEVFADGVILTIPGPAGAVDEDGASEHSGEGFEEETAQPAAPPLEAAPAGEAEQGMAAGAAAEGQVEAEHGELGTEEVGDTDAEVAVAEPTAGRPQLTVVGSGDAQTGVESVAEGQAPPQAASPEAEAGPVPPRSRRESPPPPAAVVVPSYRAWADVIASASEAEPEPPSPPEEGDEVGGEPAEAPAEAFTAVLGDPDQPLLVGVPIIEADDLEQRTPAPMQAEDAAEDVAAGISAAGGWSVRKSPRQQLLSARMAERRREQAMRAAQEAISEADKGRRRRDRDLEPLNPGAIPLQVDELIHRKKGADAAALLQRAAQELELPGLAELAMGAGDRLAELGQTKAAINCYLGAWRADPLGEAPLWRLSETCLADHSVEQAVGYLQRIADLKRARGDDEGAIGVYRRIVSVAPDNKEVREVLRHLHATGRLLD
jgi:hypothetical protein